MKSLLLNPVTPSEKPLKLSGLFIRGEKGDKHTPPILIPIGHDFIPRRMGPKGFLGILCLRASEEFLGREVRLITGT